MEGGEEEDYPELLSDFEPSKKSDFKRRLPTSDDDKKALTVLLTTKPIGRKAVFSIM
jgi:hypothetical protein